MKPALQLSIGQHLTLTPQLQQAIRLLQFSSLELQREIQTLIDSNPMLELKEEFSEQQTTSHKDHPSANYEENTTEHRTVENDNPWEPANHTVGTRRSSSNTIEHFEKQVSASETLHEYLSAQINLLHLSKQDQLIATALVDAINDQGLLGCSLEEIQQSLNNQQDIDCHEPIELDEIAVVLQSIQNVEPVGIGARDLRECLLLQLRQFPSDTPWLTEALLVLDKHFDLLGKRDYLQLMRDSKLTKNQLENAVMLIKSLNPRPANQIEHPDPHYIIPEVIVARREGRWYVELNEDALPKLSINQHYSTLINTKQKADDHKFLRGQLQEARWFLKSLNSRNQTLLRVATFLFEYQQAFLDLGESAMRPLVLHQVAEAVGLHESTISRVTTNKYAETPHGIFELKFFFSSLVGNEEGAEHSATAIRALLKKLILEEDRRKPLSDDKIANLLATQGIKVARRTVAKYREALNIPPSNERKSLI